MKAFDDLFHAELHSLSPSNDAKLQEVQRSYGSSPTMLSAALAMQDAIMKHMKRSATIQGETITDNNLDPGITGAVLHNLLHAVLHQVGLHSLLSSGKSGRPMNK